MKNIITKIKGATSSLVGKILVAQAAVNTLLLTGVPVYASGKISTSSVNSGKTVLSVAENVVNVVFDVVACAGLLFIGKGAYSLVSGFLNQNDDGNSMKKGIGEVLAGVALVTLRTLIKSFFS